MREPFRPLQPDDFIEYSRNRLCYDVVYMNNGVEETRNHHRVGLFNDTSAARAANIIAETHNLGIETEAPDQHTTIFRFVPRRS